MSQGLRHLARLVALLLLSSNTEAGLAMHPQDGAHADIKIRIGERAVTMDVVLNLVYLDEVVPSSRESPTDVHPVEEGPISAALLEFFAADNTVRIDGLDVSPRLAEFELIRPDPMLLPLFPMTGMRGLLRLRLLLEYPAKTMPSRVDLIWGTFPLDTINAEPGQDPPPATIEAQLVAEGQFSIIMFTHIEPGHTWHATGLSLEDRFLDVPDLVEPPSRSLRLPGVSLAVGLASLLAIGLIGLRRAERSHRGAAMTAVAFIGVGGAWLMRDAWAVSIELGVSRAHAPIAEPEALAVFKPLHANIYRAFDYETESEIYDALARSVHGELLEGLYAQVFQSLIMHEEGGAVSRVQAVRMMHAEVESSGLRPDGVPGFSVLARWQVDGVVYHFGHSHWRTNEYLARYGLRHGSSGWRIDSSVVLEQIRVLEGTDDPMLAEPDEPWIPDEI